MTTVTTGRIDLGLSNAQLATTQTTPRAAEPGAGDQFRTMMTRGATTAIAGLERAMPFLPGGVSTTTAVRSMPGGATAPTSATLDASSGAATSGLVDSSAGQAFDLLALQQQIGLEQQRFTTMSNVMKARHDTAKSLIGNVR